VLAAALLAGCSAAVKTAATSSASPAAQTEPPNAAVPRVGAPGPIRLDDDQRAQLERAVAAASPSVRPRLRYALAQGDDGKRHLVVYDGQGLGESGNAAGKKREYVVFQVLNATDGEHYDPQQNAVIAPIPVPPERSMTTQ
jgi:hypothetical protein